MTTGTRANRVRIALKQMLPDDHTWTERCDAEWRTTFPCGFEPLFVHSTDITVCPDQVVKAGAPLSDADFEDLLDALIEWLWVSATPYIFEESIEHILQLLTDTQPVHDMVLKAAAASNSMTLINFLGADRAPYMQPQPNQRSTSNE
jgi:hypothetical protein